MRVLQRHLNKIAKVTYFSDADGTPSADKYGNPVPVGSPVDWPCRTGVRNVSVGVQTADGILHTTVEVIEIVGEPLAQAPRPGDQIVLPSGVVRTLSAGQVAEIPGLSGPEYLRIRVGA